MRGLNRNKRRFYYALFTGKTPYVDEYGNTTTEYEVSYSNPVKCYGNISPEKNVDTVAIFGTELKYDRVICLADKAFPVYENSVLWLDTMPVIDETTGQTETPWDYVVSKVARSINGVNVAISRVDVTHA